MPVTEALESRRGAPHRIENPTNILVVEPDVFLRHAILQSLKRDGYAITLLASLPEAVNHLRSHATPVDILLASIDAEASAATGFELCHEFIARNRSTKVLIVSNRLTVRKLAEAARWTAMQKPFTGEKLRSKVKFIAAMPV